MVPWRLQVPLCSPFHGLGGSVATELQQEPRAESQATNPGSERGCPWPPSHRPGERRRLVALPALWQ